MNITWMLRPDPRDHQQDEAREQQTPVASIHPHTRGQNEGMNDSFSNPVPVGHLPGAYITV